MHVVHRLLVICSLELTIFPSLPSLSPLPSPFFLLTYFSPLSSILSVIQVWLCSQCLSQTPVDKLSLPNQPRLLPEKGGGTLLIWSSLILYVLRELKQFWRMIKKYHSQVSSVFGCWML